MITLDAADVPGLDVQCIGDVSCGVIVVPGYFVVIFLFMRG